MLKKLSWIVPILFFLGGCCSAQAELNLQNLPEQDIQTVKTILAKLEPLIKEREAAETLATLRFEEMYEPLTEEEKAFLTKFQTLDPVAAGIKTQWRGLADGNTMLVKVENQMIVSNGEKKPIPIQYVPIEVYPHYVDMMNAMQKDIGKRLYIESGYRSSAYQLYLFIFYLKKRDYSIMRTAEWNALPGYSEHGDPARQALDFINEEGINGEDNPADFEALPEYDWLMKNAARFGFVLSYPRNSPEGIGFEPWHWHFEKDLLARQTGDSTESA